MASLLAPTSAEVLSGYVAHHLCFRKAMGGNFASPHGDDVVGETTLARMDNNFSVVAVRPAGGV